MNTTPRTLVEAHELVSKIRPPLDAPLSKWLQFRQHAARIYTEVADVDRFHHHEATYWAAFERAKAEAVQRQINGTGEP